MENMHFMMSEYCTLEKTAFYSEFDACFEIENLEKSANFDRDKQLLGDTITLYTFYYRFATTWW